MLDILAPSLGMLPHCPIEISSVLVKEAECASLVAKALTTSMNLAHKVFKSTSNSQPSL